MSERFDPYAEEYFEDPWPAFKALRDEAPVFHNKERNFYAVSRYEDVVRCLKDWESLSSTSGTMLDLLNTPGFSALDGGFDGWFVFFDPPMHNRWRKPVQAEFTATRVAVLEDDARRVISRLLDECEGKTDFDIGMDVCAAFPAEVIHDLCAIPEADRERILELSRDFLSASDRAGAAIEQMTEYLAALAAERRENPGDDFVSRLAAAEFEDDDGDQRTMRDLEIAGIVLNIVAGGSETTMKIVTSAIVQFSRFPGEWEKVVANPGKIADAVEEAGRMDAPGAYEGRRATRDIEVQGTTIPAGSNVLLLLASGNRDERAFPDPDSFDVDRDMRANRPLTWGWGPHKCVGMALARLEARVAIEEMAKRYEGFEVDESGLVRARSVITAGYNNVPVTVRARPVATHA